MTLHQNPSSRSYTRSTNRIKLFACICKHSIIDVRIVFVRSKMAETNGMERFAYSSLPSSTNAVCRYCLENRENFLPNSTSLAYRVSKPRNTEKSQIQIVVLIRYTCRVIFPPLLRTSCRYAHFCIPLNILNLNLTPMTTGRSIRMDDLASNRYRIDTALHSRCREQRIGKALKTGCVRMRFLELCFGYDSVLSILWMSTCSTFVRTVKRGRNELTRQSTESSVTIPHEMTYRNLTNDGSNTALFNFCGCGWPQNMLIPKGSPEGLQCQLFVMVSNGANDVVRTEYLSGLSPAGGVCFFKNLKRYNFFISFMLTPVFDETFLILFPPVSFIEMSI